MIELLVVVAIMALLMAILLPSLGNARLRAKHTVCAANLRTLGQATELYLDEYNGEFFRYYSKINGATPGYLWWFGFELNGPGTTTYRPLDKTRSPLAPYTSGLDVRMLCPLFPYDAAGYYPKFAVHSATYAYNMKLGPVDPTKLSKRDTYAQRAANVMVFADGIQFDPSAGAGFNEGHYIEYNAFVTNPSLGMDGYAHFRHNGFAQYVMMDGHVEQQLLAGAAYRTVNGAMAGNLVGADGTNSIYGF